jgi:hypothetical protein
VNDVYNDDDEEGKGRQVALSIDAARQKADLDQQITTAKSFPRSYKKFADKCMSLATANEDVAAGMLYSLPRGGKPIEGASARMAEVIQHAWGNNHTGQRVIEEGEEFVTAEGVFYDLENNVKVVVQVKRRITDKEGRRFNTDMIGVTGNAAASIAHRNAVLKGVPKSFWQPIYLAARKAAVGDIKTLAAKRSEAIAYVTKYGVTEAQIFAALGVDGVEDIDVEKLITLRATVESVKSKELTIDEAFPTVPTVSGAKKKTAPPANPKADVKGPQKKKAAPPKPAKPMTVDQITAIRDKLKEEGVAESLLLAKMEAGSFQELEAAEFKRCISLIDDISTAGT